jgi:hypothetical protein
MNDMQTQVPGWGVDRNPENRPGYPLEQERHLGFDTVQGRPPYTDTVPLKGLSGIIRRAAYKREDWQPSRWMMLMLADRIDAFEAKLTPRNLLVAGGLGGVVAALFLRRKLK